MTSKGEAVIYALMELQETSDVETMYTVMDESVHAYLKQLHSTVPVEVLLESHYVEVAVVLLLTTRYRETVPSMRRTTTTFPRDARAATCTWTIECNVSEVSSRSFVRTFRSFPKWLDSSRMRYRRTAVRRPRRRTK